jgi:hypothetical protein
LEAAEYRLNFAAEKINNNKKSNSYEDEVFFRSSVSNDGPDDRM